MKLDFETKAGLFALAFALLLAGSWIANLVKLIGSDFSILNGMIVGRAIGVFLPPVGIVLGWF